MRFESQRVAGKPGDASVAIAVSVTASIRDDVVRQNPEAAIYELRPEDVAPSRALLEGRASMDAFSSTYYALLGEVEAAHTDCRAIDLFAAVPAPGAVQLGRGLMRDTQPTLRVHDRDPEKNFVLAIELRR